MNYQKMQEAQRRARAIETGIKMLNVGDKVYQTDGVMVYESTIKNVVYETESIAFDERAIGRSIFLTREEAEQALKEAQDEKTHE